MKWLCWSLSVGINNWSVWVQEVKGAMGWKWKWVIGPQMRGRRRKEEGIWAQEWWCCDTFTHTPIPISYPSFFKGKRRDSEREKMAEYDERYEGNGEEEDLHNSHAHPHLDSSPQPTHDDLTDSKSHVCFLALSLSLFLPTNPLFISPHFPFYFQLGFFHCFLSFAKLGFRDRVFLFPLFLQFPLHLIIRDA